MKKIKLKDRIARIMREFDFASVLLVMKLTKWKWNGKRPSMKDIKTHAVDLLKRCGRKKLISAACGGFVARWSERPGECGEQLSLAFEIYEVEE